MCVMLFISDSIFFCTIIFLGCLCLKLLVNCCMDCYKDTLWLTLLESEFVSGFGCSQGPIFCAGFGYQQGIALAKATDAFGI